MPRRRLRDLSIIQNPPNSKETNSEQQTAIGSSNVPNTADEPTKIQTESGGRCKTRRRTLLKNLYNLNSVERVKDRERVGTTSRQKQKFTHTAGSKSFACVADDEELSSGQKVGHLQFFDITHRKKDRSPMTTEAAKIMEKLKDKRAEYEAITSRSFVSPTQYFGSSSQQYMHSTNQAQAKVQRLRDQMAQMQASTIKQIAQLKAEAASREAEAQRKYELQLQLKADVATREAEANRKYVELQLQLQNMMKMFQQSQNPPS
ncbi:Magnesium-protoporphyrin IX monomethyl ester [oxidative] cyclase 2 [Gossypium arboreum]|uniref:Magnesium-protoporphyrin IX monomethyl ester [oxidative] cyclase 2 n=1 Tax=Gossypium arboreum TaxID=29729 RepID=A0A0B0NHF5_GOSAR|nr:Magnesium-protoporphyrin IX monomethyl ester [oxidative] cyclase 2 [Gossypium arboreum]